MKNEMTTMQAQPVAGEADGHSAAERFLRRLKAQGVDCFYVGSGTDTAPIVEAYAKAGAAAAQLYPHPVIATHENLAIGMAHGHYMVSGRMQAVILHVSVGTANAVCGLMNAARGQVPMLLTAGRTPLFEDGRLGARNSEIHWGQEMFDQGAMLRELVKWDYELRDGSNVDEIVDRAFGIAMAHPRAPVYLSLPREVLAQSLPGAAAGRPVAVPTAPQPDEAALARLAQVFDEARHPVIVCESSGADPATVALLADLAERFGIGVAETRARFVNFPASHPLHLGHETKAVFAQADALLFLECEVPWVPSRSEPSPEAFVAHGGSDPLFSRYPVRTHRSDLSITATAAALIERLARALQARGAQARAGERRARLEATARAVRQQTEQAVARDEAAGGAITKAFLSRCLQAVRPADSIVVNEYPLAPQQMCFDEPGTYFYVSASAGLGWGLPAALGAQQAAPDRVVIAALGDGSYLFANPAVCHHAAAMHELPVLTVLCNNMAWGAVSQAALGMYPGQHAAQHAKAHGTSPLSSLEPMPDFERYIEASGGHGERVTERAQLLPALRRALEVVQRERRQALVNVITQG